MANDLIIKEVESTLLETTSEKYEAIESELNEIKDNLIDTASKVSIQIPKAIELADAAQNAKMYEALAKLIVAYSSLNRDAAAIIKQKQDLYDGFRNKNKAPQQIDNRSVNFYGTATELLDQVLPNKNK